MQSFKILGYSVYLYLILTRRFRHITYSNGHIWYGNNIYWHSLLHESWGIETWRLQLQIWRLVGWIPFHCFDINVLIIWRSLGAILYELCTLDHAFQAQVGGVDCGCYVNDDDVLFSHWWLLCIKLLRESPHGYPITFILTLKHYSPGPCLYYFMNVYIVCVCVGV